MDFMDQRIQPLLVEAGKTSIDAKVFDILFVYFKILVWLLFAYFLFPNYEPVLECGDMLSCSL